MSNLLHYDLWNHAKLTGTKTVVTVLSLIPNLWNHAKLTGTKTNPIFDMFSISLWNHVKSTDTETPTVSHTLHKDLWNHVKLTGTKTQYRCDIICLPLEPCQTDRYQNLDTSLSFVMMVIQYLLSLGSY